MAIGTNKTYLATRDDINSVINGTSTVAKATSATYATNASTSSYSSNGAKATSATYATTATNAGTATYATNAGTATYSSNGAKATSATSATYATTAVKAGTASTATYVNASTVYSKRYYIRDTNNINVGQIYAATNGTTANTGASYIIIGNDKATSAAGNSKGVVRMYDATSFYADLKTTNNFTANRTIYIPNASSTIAVMANLNRTNSVHAANTGYSTYMARGIAAGTSALTAGSTTMTNGVIYLQYE